MSADSVLRLPLSALASGLNAAEAAGIKDDVQDLSALGGVVDLRALELDEEELEGRRATLLTELGDVEATGLVFEQDGAPSTSTFGVALVLTARRAVELDFPLIKDLVAAASEAGTQSAHTARAELALAKAVSTTLEEMEAAEQFTDASTTAAVSVNDAPQAQTMEEAKSMHMRWAILELARARYAEDRPEDWGSVRE